MDGHRQTDGRLNAWDRRSERVNPSTWQLFWPCSGPRAMPLRGSQWLCAVRNGRPKCTTMATGRGAHAVKF